MDSTLATFGSGHSVVGQAQVRGFSATAEKPVEYMVNGESSATPPTVPCSGTSRRVFDLLAGMQDLATTLALISAPGEAPGPGRAALRTEELSLVLIDESPCTGIAFRRSEENQVALAAVKLTADVSKGWIAEPLAVFGEVLKGAVTLHFHSPSVSALLELTSNSFFKLLTPARESKARLAYVRIGGTAFYPQAPNAHHWRVAAMWPVWQRRKLNFPAREHELSNIENRADKGSEVLRQLCSRRLGLRVGDTTDS